MQHGWILVFCNLLMAFLAAGFQELAADLVDAAVAHCQLIVVSK